MVDVIIAKTRINQKNLNKMAKGWNSSKVDSFRKGIFRTGKGFNFIDRSQVI